MIEWSEQHLMIRDAIRKFIEAEIKPRVEELEHGDTPPYDILRKMMRTFGMDVVASQRFERQIAIHLNSGLLAYVAAEETQGRRRNRGVVSRSCRSSIYRRVTNTRRARPRRSW